MRLILRQLSIWELWKYINIETFVCKKCKSVFNDFVAEQFGADDCGEQFTYFNFNFKWKLSKTKHTHTNNQFTLIKTYEKSAIRNS